MSDTLYPYYESELFFVRQLAQEFAKKYPAAAARLQLEPTRSIDPHVERLIEAFALIAGRVQHKIHDEFPELTDGMLSVLYPHVLSPVPSAAVVQFHPDPNRPNPNGYPIPAGSMVRTQRVGDVPCRYRTCYPTTLWPMALTEAKLLPPPFPTGLNPPLRAMAALRLRFKAFGNETFDKLAIESLRLHLLGDNTLTAPLYDLLTNHALQVVFRAPDKPPIARDATEVLRPVGFEPADALLPFPANVFPGYRLLTEYFAFPPKFQFVDLGGWDAVRALGPVKEFEAVVFLGRSHPRLEQLLDAGMLRPGCTPVLNLFELTAEPIPLTHAKTEYRVTPDVGHPLGYEPYSIQTVTAVSGDGTNREYRPFYHFRHGGSRDKGQPFWYSTRRPGTGEQDHGTDLFLHLVDSSFDPTEATDEAVVVRMLCTNRDLPTRLPRVGDEVRVETEFAAPGVRVQCVRSPTPPLRPPPRRGRFWHLISHLNLNHLSLTADGEGLEAFKGMLRLYDLTDPEAEPQAAALARQAIDGVIGLSSRRVTGWVGGDAAGGFARGTEVTLDLDESKYVGASPVLFAAVLDRFFALYAGVNSFTQLVAKLKQQDGELKRWPPRAGDRPVG